MTNDFDPKTIRKSLDALRAKHGAGFESLDRVLARAPTILEMVGSMTPEELANWEDGGNCNAGKDDGDSVADLARLSSGEPHDAEE